eukprot:11792689-Prorocentrum_lima.AAC.1
MAHALRLHMQKHPANTVVSLDAVNAFGSIDRAVCLAGVAKLLPEAYPMALAFCERPTHIFSTAPEGNTVWFTSSSGMPQGHPLGP